MKATLASELGVFWANAGHVEMESIGTCVSAVEGSLDGSDDSTDSLVTCFSYNFSLGLLWVNDSWSILGEQTLILPRSIQSGFE